ncbi:hypothetical protein LDENG_00045680 [Lucifuga dentata]|nr:hypothetical protein LDENG_00045680 [Lucifuga dentata]
MRVRKYEHITPILQALHCPQPFTQNLRSGNSNLLYSPRTKLCTMGHRAFCSTAPSLWNALPDHLRAPQSVDTFKKALKTYLFNRAFCWCCSLASVLVLAS